MWDLQRCILKIWIIFMRLTTLHSGNLDNFYIWDLQRCIPKVWTIFRYETYNAAFRKFGQFLHMRLTTLHSENLDNSPFFEKREIPTLPTSSAFSPFFPPKSVLSIVQQILPTFHEGRSIFRIFTFAWLPEITNILHPRDSKGPCFVEQKGKKNFHRN